MVNGNEIVEARKEHMQQMVLLINEAYWEQQQPFFIDTLASRERINLAELDKIMSDPNQRTYVLINKKNHRVAGTIIIELPAEEEQAKVGLLAIGKEYRGKKLGHTLVEYVENYARTLGRKLIKLEVFIFAKKLINYYESLGYSFTGNTAPFFHGNCIREKYRNSSDHYLSEMAKKL